MNFHATRDDWQTSRRAAPLARAATLREPIGSRRDCIWYLLRVQRESSHQLAVGVASDGARLSWYGINALVTIDIHPIESMVRQGDNLLQLPSVSGIGKNALHIVVNRRQPALDIGHCDNNMSGVQFDGIG